MSNIRASNMLSEVNSTLAAISMAESSIRSLREHLRLLQVPSEPVTSVSMSRSPGYWLQGEWHTKLTACEILVSVFSAFSHLDSSFPVRFANNKANYGRTRRHVANNREALYPNRPDLCRYSEQFSPGWFIGTNENNITKMRLLSIAGDLMGFTSKGKFWYRFP
jgi:hypothetical protein